MTRTLFVTPNFTSDVWQCRTLTTPNNAEWLGVFNKVLLEMLNPYNWEQINDTDLTVEETIAICQAIIDAYFNNDPCYGTGLCTLPGDFPVFRLGVTGHYEMLAGGEWVTPTGDYAIPPTPPRTEPTEAERKCAAAANAAFVLKETYEQVTDAVAAGATQAEALLAFVEAILLYTGSWIAAPIYAIAQALVGLFFAFVEIAEFIGMDVWTVDFDNKLKCALLDCATDTGEVVTFDLACIREALTVTVDLLSPTAQAELLLFGQIDFMLNLIGADGLSAAGATTSIEDANCDDCLEEWSACFDFLVDDGEWTAATCYTASVYSAAGWGRNANGIVGINRTFAPALITSFGIELDMPLTGNYHRMFWIQDGDVCTDPSNEVNIGAAVEWGIYDLTGETTSLQLVFQNGTPNTSYPLDFHIVKVNVNGRGFNPFTDYPPCEE